MEMFAAEVGCECSECGNHSLDLCKCPCGTAYYCGTACQENHWDQHKNDCAAAYKGQKALSSCVACGNTSMTLKSCLCGSALYCDTKCQQAHWGTHRRMCSSWLRTTREKKKRQRHIECQTEETHHTHLALEQEKIAEAQKEALERKRTEREAFKKSLRKSRLSTLGSASRLIGAASRRSVSGRSVSGSPTRPRGTTPNPLSADPSTRSGSDRNVTVTPTNPEEDSVRSDATVGSESMKRVVKFGGRVHSPSDGRPPPSPQTTGSPLNNRTRTVTRTSLSSPISQGPKGLPRPPKKGSTAGGGGSSDSGQESSLRSLETPEKESSGDTSPQQQIAPTSKLAERSASPLSIQSSETNSHSGRDLGAGPSHQLNYLKESGGGSGSGGQNSVRASQRGPKDFSSPSGPLAHAEGDSSQRTNPNAASSSSPASSSAGSTKWHVPENPSGSTQPPSLSSSSQHSTRSLGITSHPPRTVLNSVQPQETSPSTFSAAPTQPLGSGGGSDSRASTSSGLPSPQGSAGRYRTNSGDDKQNSGDRQTNGGGMSSVSTASGTSYLRNGGAGGGEAEVEAEVPKALMTLTELQMLEKQSRLKLVVGWTTWLSKLWSTPEGRKFVKFQREAAASAAAAAAAPAAETSSPAADSSAVSPSRIRPGMGGILGSPRRPFSNTPRKRAKS